MAHAIWSGAINFGLVSIPVRLVSAVRANDLSFHMLHAKDKGRIHNERVCDVCHKKVEWADLVKGYEYDDGKYVVLDEKDFEAAAPELTKSIDIEEFVDLDQVDPRFFDTPYYLEPEKKGAHAYAVLREALLKSKKVGIARVVLRTREHLAALKPVGNALTLELMHFNDELVPPEDVDVPTKRDTISAGEMKAAMMLVNAMEGPFEPKRYKDTYRETMLQTIQKKAKGKKITAAAPKAARAKDQGLDDIVSALQRSLTTRAKGRAAAAKSPKGTKAAKPARGTKARS
jgi:DNA end-binding protein Ku